MKSCISYEQQQQQNTNLDKWLGSKQIFYQNNILFHNKYIPGGYFESHLKIIRWRENWMLWETKDMCGEV